MNWTCPHCNQKQTATAASVGFVIAKLDGGTHVSRFESRKCMIETRQCANSDCNQLTIFVNIGYKDKLVRKGGEGFEYEPDFDHNLFSGQVYPSPKGRVQPACIPQQIVKDYQEACLIRDLSPKASATLARRAVQGIIRDFASISKNRLVDEIDELRTRIGNGTAPPEFTLDIVDAIDGIRQIGNIGAHMEKDVNIITDVDPDEADLLIELIEDMFEMLYVARENRKQRLSKLNAITQSKAAQRKQAAQATAPSPAVGTSGSGSGVP